jgi:hypothetical protein
MSVLLRPELDTFTANAYDAVRLEHDPDT